MSALLTHGLGFRMPGRFWKDIGMRPMCRAVTRPPGPRLNTCHTHYYGQIHPLAQRNLETRVIARLEPRAVHCDAIHR